ncbi:hypothetical protein [Pelagibacterium sediminicola]|uniref:hypothetical protein n=1 Tax=Pelagibacterium sediminicola TaxID=2248761 RepID=UPI000E31587F|nr:hypothetical protein [Pelagibacterium sediminicola]
MAHVTGSILVVGVGFLMSPNSSAAPKAGNPFLDGSAPNGDNRSRHDKVCSACSKRMMRVQKKCPHRGVDPHGDARRHPSTDESMHALRSSPDEVEEMRRIGQQTASCSLEADGRLVVVQEDGSRRELKR